ncbi:hypothetical protein [Luteolibacter soli]|uniref:DUF2167 domain-containing protein n=1 Tax=Luteolibacter soli TaxID=3135280 RepID=A0ABU9AW02_9BACT
MKFTILLLFLVGSTMISSATPEQEAGEHQRISYWRGQLAEAGDLDAQPVAQKIETLGTVLRGIGWPADYRYAGAEAATFQKEVQAALLAIPGHAKHFADKIEREREEAQAIPRTAQIKYDSVRSFCLMGIFPHLPSPEAVQVLGHYLDDERDIPRHEVDKSRERDYITEPENAWLAVGALSTIGLRDSPYPPLRFVDSAKGIPEQAVALPKFRAWYAEIKEGRRAFSFLGQKVEYRFMPDGSWETAPLAISDEEIRKEQELPELISRAVPSPTNGEVAPAPSFPASWWPGLVSVVTALAVVGAWFARKRSQHA